MAAGRMSPEEEKEEAEANAFIDEQEARLIELGIDDPPSPVTVEFSDEARARLDLPSGETPAEQEEMDISRHAENLLEEQRKKESDSFVEVNAPAPPFSQLASEIPPPSPPSRASEIAGAVGGAVVGAVSGGADIVARVAGGAAGAVGDALWEAAPVLPDAGDVGRGVAEGLMAAGGAAVRGVVGAGAGLVEALVEDTPAAVVTDEGELLEEVVPGEAQAPEIRDSLSLYGNEFLTDASLLAGRSGPRGARDEDIRPQYEIVNRTNKEYKGIPAGGSAPVTAYQTDAFGYTTGSGVRGIKRTKYTTLQKEIEKGRLLLKKL